MNRHLALSRGLRLSTVALALFAALAATAAQATDISWAATKTQAFLPATGIVDALSSATPTDPTSAVLAKVGTTAAPMQLSTVKHIALSLNPRNRAALDAQTWAAQGPGSATTLASMTQADYLAYYAPTDAQIQAVTSYLQQNGFINISVSASRRLVTADATVANIQAAFNTSLKAFTYQGRMLYANATPAQVPANLGGLVNAVFGLQDVSVAQPFFKAADSYDAARAADHSKGNLAAHALSDFAKLYHADSLPTGVNTTLAIVASGNLARVLNDLKAYTKANNLPPVTVQVVRTDGGPYLNDANAAASWDLAAQGAVAAAGGVRKLIFYNPSDLSDVNLLKAYSKILDDFSCSACSKAAATIVLNTYGMWESDAYKTGFMAAADDILGNNAYPAPSYIFASGDSGAYAKATGTLTDYLGQQLVDPQYFSVNYPASSPVVSTVGGTSLYTAADGSYLAETTWNGGIEPVDPTDSYSDWRLWATGGGVSKFENPQHMVSIQYKTTRVLPDVAFAGDSASGAWIYQLPNGATTPITLQAGGTALSAALFAGFMARLYNGGVSQQLPVLPIYTPELGGFRREQFVNPVNSGLNGYSGYGWPSVIGIDGTSGWGSLNMSVYSQLWSKWTL